MKIMLIEPLEDGGLAHYAYNLADALSRRGLNVLLYTSASFELADRRTSFEVCPNMFKGAARISALLPWLYRESSVPSLVRRAIKVAEYPFNAAECLAFAKKKRVDVVHFQTVNLIELVMVTVFKMAHTKVVFTIHNVMPRHQRLRFYHRPLYRLLYSLCDHLIIHSKSGKREVGELFCVAPEKISVIPHGDYKFFVPRNCMTTEEAKAALGLPGTCRTVLFFGAIRPNKGLDNLLRALPYVKHAIPDVTLMVVGEPCENYDKYSRIIEQEDLERNVFERLGYVPNEGVALYFSASDLVVLPYNEITQSGVLQIAYAFGKPVVATALEGFHESVEDGGNGFLVRRGDSKDLAGRIVEILSDSAKREVMGRRSRYLSDTRYSWDAIQEQTANVYAHVLSG